MSPSKPPVTPEQLAALPPDFRALLQAIIDYYEQRLAKQDRRITELEARLNKSPENSSLPPSSQHPHAKPPRREPKSKNKRGGQPGHAKHERPLLPSDKCDDVHTLKPSECRRCGALLAGLDDEPLRHQVWEVPEIRPIVTEYQRHRLRCADCGTFTCAELPPGVPTGQAGPRLIALTALLMGCFRQSKRRVALFLEQVLDQPCSTGWVVKLQHQATDALRANWQELAEQLPDQASLGIDETPSKEGRSKTWLWTCVARSFTVFALRPTRAASVLRELLGHRFAGVTNCDRARMYWSLGRLQWCWAHLKRDFQALVDSDNHQAQRLGHDLLRPTRAMFRHWARTRDGTLTWRGFQRVMRPLREEIEALLLRGVFSGNPRLVGICAELYHHRERLWTFVEIAGIEPTNNASERALRQAVIWRKLSFGTQSASGSRFVETMLTVVETCRQQNRRVFAHLVTAIEAHLAGRPAPSLLPSV